MHSRRWRTPKISCFDPPLRAIWTPDSAKPLPAFLHPPVELATGRPCGCLDLNRRIDLAAIGFAVLTRIEVTHTSSEHDCESPVRGPRRRPIAHTWPSRG